MVGLASCLSAQGSLQLQECWVQDAHATCATFAALSELRCLEVDVVDSQGQPLLPDLQECVQLTRLRLNCMAEPVIVYDEAGEDDQQQQLLLHEARQLGQLSALVKLQHLDLCGLTVGVPSRVLGQLVELTCLRLHYDEDRRGGWGVDPFITGQLQHLSCLTALQELSVCVQNGQLTASSMSGVEHLPQLTSLELEPGTDSFKFRNSSTCRWGRLTALRSLSLAAYRVQPGTIAALTQLQALSLREVYASDGTTVEDLLQAVAGLSMLASIEVVDVHSRDTTWGGLSPPAAAITALTASSSLAELKNRAQDPVLFRPGQVCPQLRRVDLIPDGGQDFIHVSEQLLQQLCSCCPALESLAVALRPRPSDTAWLPLLQLSALTYLHTCSAGARLLLLAVTATSSSAAAVLPVAAQLTGLKRLRLGHADRAARLQLTALTALTEYQLDAWASNGLHLQSKVSKAAARHLVAD